MPESPKDFILRIKGGLGEAKLNEWGKPVITFPDHDGIQCSVEGSNALPDGTKALWLGLNKVHHRMLLDEAQVQRLVNSLQQWLDHGNFGE